MGICKSQENSKRNNFNKLQSIVEKPIEDRVNFFDTDGMQRSMRLKEIVHIRTFIEDLKLFHLEALTVVQNVLQLKGNYLLLEEGKYINDCYRLIQLQRNLKLNYFDTITNLEFTGETQKKYQTVLIEIIQQTSLEGLIIINTLLDKSFNISQKWWTYNYYAPRREKIIKEFSLQNYVLLEEKTLGLLEPYFEHLDVLKISILFLMQSFQIQLQNENKCEESQKIEMEFCIKLYKQLQEDFIKNQDILEKYLYKFIILSRIGNAIQSQSLKFSQQKIKSKQVE